MREKHTFFSSSLVKKAFFYNTAQKERLLSCVYTHKHHLRTCSENLFFHELLANQGKMMNQLRRQLCENCWRDRKIFPQTWKITKIQTNTVPTEPQTSFVFVKKPTGDGSQRTVCKQFTNNVLIMRCSQVYSQLYMSGGSEKWAR